MAISTGECCIRYATCSKGWQLQCHNMTGHAIERMVACRLVLDSVSSNMVDLANLGSCKTIGHLQPFFAMARSK